MGFWFFSLLVFGFGFRRIRRNQERERKLQAKRTSLGSSLLLNPTSLISIPLQFPILFGLSLRAIHAKLCPTFPTQRSVLGKRRLLDVIVISKHLGDLVDRTRALVHVGEIVPVIVHASEHVFHAPFGRIIVRLRRRRPATRACRGERKRLDCAKDATGAARTAAIATALISDFMIITSRLGFICRACHTMWKRVIPV